jgi:hypothetical protein
MAPHGIHCSLGTQVLLREVNTRLRPSVPLTWEAASELWGGRSEAGEHDWLYHTTLRPLLKLLIGSGSGRKGGVLGPHTLARLLSSSAASGKDGRREFLSVVDAHLMPQPEVALVGGEAPRLWLRIGAVQMAMLGRFWEARAAQPGSPHASPPPHWAAPFLPADALELALAAVRSLSGQSAAARGSGPQAWSTTLRDEAVGWGALDGDGVRVFITDGDGVRQKVDLRMAYCDTPE